MSEKPMWLVVLTTVNIGIALIVRTAPISVERVSIEPLLIRHDKEIAQVQDKLLNCINDLSWWKKESGRDYIFTEDRCVCVTYDNRNASSKDGVLGKKEICEIGD